MKKFIKRSYYLIQIEDNSWKLGYREFFLGIFPIGPIDSIGMPFNSIEALQRKMFVHNFNKCTVVYPEVNISIQLSV